MKKRIAGILLACSFLGALSAAGCDTDSGEKNPPTLEKVKCTVTFIMPDGSEQTRTVTKGGSLSLADLPRLQIEGYTARWNGDFSTIGEDRTVGFTKTANTYQVQYDTESVSLPAGTQDSFSVTYDSDYELATPERVPDGYYFWYWYYGNDIPVAGDGTWKIAKNVTLKARYEERMMGKYKVMFVGETGTQPIVYWVDEGEDFTQAFPDVPTADGYDFSWNKTADDLKSIGEDKTVSLVKTGKTYQVTLDLNYAGAQISSTTVTATYGETLRLPVPVAPVSDDFEFAGWKVQGEEKYFISGQTIYSYTSGITLVAQWKQGDAWTGYF